MGRSNFGRPIKFSLGVVHVSPPAFELIAHHDFDLVHLLKRHREGDYGWKVPYDDRVINEKNIQIGGEINSFYELPEDTVIHIVTGAGWSDTYVHVKGEA